MARAYSPSEILSKKYKTLKWGPEFEKAFDKPETSGIWFVWGNSGNGKTNLVMQLICELSTYYKVFYNALEEGTRLTMQRNIQRISGSLNSKNLLIGSESLAELDSRLNKQKSPQIIIIDSIQYTGLTWLAYRKFKEAHPDKLIIFISHAKGKNPAGETAMRVKYDADLKIWVEGFVATSNGRYNPGGEFKIWDEGAIKHHSTLKK